MIRTPDDTHRCMYIGRTGTGKSQAAIAQLADQNFNEIPWVIIDYKGEDLLRDIIKRNRSAIKTIKVTDKPPKKPGLYYMNPAPKDDDGAMEVWLRNVHRQGSLGIYIDEGYALPKFGDSPAFTMILTQGRSLHIPVICLYQRPVWMSRFAIAQADFIRVFKQGDERDEKITKNFCRPAILPDGSKLGPLELDRLPDYFSLWHDVGRGHTAILKPAPDRNTIIGKFTARLKPTKKKGSFI